MQRLAAHSEHLQALGSSLNTLATTQAEQSALLATQAQQLTAQEQHISAVLTGQDQRLERLAEEVRLSAKSKMSIISAVLLVALGAALALAAVGIAIWLLPAG